MTPLRRRLAASASRNEKGMQVWTGRLLATRIPQRQQRRVSNFYPASSLERPSPPPSSPSAKPAFGSASLPPVKARERSNGTSTQA